MAVLDRVPWWAVVVAAALLVGVGLALPHLLEGATGAAAGLLGIKAAGRRSAARDRATDAVEQHEEQVRVENVQTEQRQRRAAERAAEAEEERTAAPDTSTPLSDRIGEDPFA